jgi:hypothetical protein
MTGREAERDGRNQVNTRGMVRLYQNHNLEKNVESMKAIGVGIM